MSALAAYARREAVRRPGRTVLGLLGVVLGVAAMVASALATSAAGDAYRAMYASLTGRAGLEVVAEGLGTFPADVLARVEGTPGVRAAVPVVLAPAAVVAPGPRTPVLVLGIDPARDGAARSLAIVEGRGVGDGDGVVLLATFARPRGLAVGDRVRLVTATGPVDLPVVGLAGPDGLAAFPGGVVVASLATARRVLGFGDRLNGVQVVLDDGAREDDVAAALTARVGPGLRVQRPAARALLADATLRSAEQGLAAVSLMSLVAAVFVILNAFAMNLAERRRALATLRALGATRGQVVRALLGEAVVLGTVGAVLGAALGVVGARGLAAGIGQMLGVDLAPPPARAGPLLAALVVGPLTTLLATAGAARRASRRDPLADLLGAPETAAPPARRGPAAVGLVCLGLLALAEVGVVTGRLPVGLIAPAVAVGMLGAALVFPAVLPALRRLLLGALGRVVGAPGRLGLRQVERRPVHTTLSSTVLFVAVVGTLGMGNELLANVADVKDWAARALVEDFFVRATMPESGTMVAAPVPAALGDELAALPGVARVNRIRFVPVRADDVPALVIGRTWTPGAPLALDFDATPPGGPPPALGPTDAVLGTALAHRLGVGPGGHVTLAGRDGPARFDVVATATEYTSGGYAVYLDFAAAERLLGANGADAFMVVAAPGRRVEVGAALATIAARDGLLLQSNAGLRADVDGKVGGIVGLLWTALAVVFVVASLGVLNTLTMNVLDQTRTIGVLRAVGTTRAQVTRSVLAQGVAIALVAVVPAVPVGVGMSWLLHLGSEPLRGFPVAFAVDVPLVVACGCAAVAVACAAATVPAWRAARLPVATTLRRD